MRLLRVLVSILPYCTARVDASSEFTAVGLGLVVV